MEDWLAGAMHDSEDGMASGSCMVGLVRGGKLRYRPHESSGAPAKYKLHDLVAALSACRFSCCQMRMRCNPGEKLFSERVAETISNVR